MSGGSLSQVKEHLAHEFKNTYLIDLAIWTPVQLFNFRYVPVLYQPVVVNCVNVGWNAYLSFVQNRDKLAMKESQQSGTRIQEEL